MAATGALTPNKSCHTILEENKRIFKWTIHNFSSYYKGVTAVIKSPEFDFMFKNNLALVLTLNIIHTHCWEVYLKVYLIGTSDKLWNCLANLYLVDKKGDAIHIKTLSMSRSCTVQEMAIPEELRTTRNDPFPGDNLTILCEIIWLDIRQLQNRDEVTYQMTVSELNKDIEDLLEDESHWDVTLVAGENEFHAHKCLLAARSDVFAAMFKYEMEENKTNRVTITDLDHVVIKEMLHYIYTGKAPNLNQMTFDLLAASTKYGLENLKHMCEDNLKRNLTISTAADTLLLADLYGTKQLKEYTIDFINNNAKAVKETEGWHKIVGDHFHLLVELYGKAIK